MSHRPACFLSSGYGLEGGGMLKYLRLVISTCEAGVERGCLQKTNCFNICNPFQADEGSYIDDIGAET